jgi:O-antigen/teichoic acid export membrane protein
MWHPLLSGINRVRLGQQIFVWALIANYLVIFGGLLLGAGLFAPVTGYLVMGLISRLTAQAKFNDLTRAKIHAPSARWSRVLLARLWPTAWRTGVVTLGIYATLNFGILICTAYLGPAMTASYGLSLQLAAAAVSISTAFVAVKTPLIAQLRARGALREIADIVIPRMRMFYATFLLLAFTAILFGEPVLRDWLHSRTSLLPMPPLAALLLVVGLEGHHAIFRELTLTAHENPFAIPVVVAGACVTLLTVLLVRMIGVWGLIAAPGIVQLCFNNWWTVLVGLRSIELSPRKYVTRLFALSPATRTLQA